VRLFSHDSAYIKSKDRASFKDLVESKKVHLLFGWSTGSTEEFVRNITKYRIPYTGVSYSEKLGDPAFAPYNFLTSASYSDQMRTILAYIRQQWTRSDRRVRVAFVHNETEFGYSPLADAEAYARAMGIDIVAREVVNLAAQEPFSCSRPLQVRGVYATFRNRPGRLGNPEKRQINEALTRFAGLIWSGMSIISLAVCIGRVS
jgi:branched-chain amino acid transport system substrate-binding protein